MRLKAYHNFDIVALALGKGMLLIYQKNIKKVLTEQHAE
jgi:hypothetical protein